jgi:hypothetical protein
LYCDVPIGETGCVQARAESVAMYSQLWCQKLLTAKSNDLARRDKKRMQQQAHHGD